MIDLDLLLAEIEEITEEVSYISVTEILTGDSIDFSKIGLDF